MPRHGVVKAINAIRGMVAIATDDDGYTIIEIVSEFEIDLGDEIAWQNGYGLGTETYVNRTKGTRDDVFVQNHSVSASSLRQQLLL